MTRLARVARRYRWGHSILFAVTVCLLVGTATVDPLLTRSFQNAIVKFHLHAQGLVGNQVSLGSGGDRAMSIPRMEHLVDPRVRAVTGKPTETMSVVATSELTGVKVRIQSTRDQCAHVHIIEGRCPKARNEVLVSKAAVAEIVGTKATLGARLPVRGSYLPAEGEHLNPHKTMKFVGVFTASPTAPFWGGVPVGEYSQPPPSGDPPPSAYLLTDRRTFSGHVPVRPLPTTGDAPASVSWSGISTLVSYPVLPARLTPESLRAAAAGIRHTESRAGDLTFFESLTQVESTTRGDVDQVRQILPFLLLQLAIVLLILLVQATTFFATVRRGEAAVLKMRGNGTAGVMRQGADELLPAWAAGTVGGLGLAYAVDELVRAVWLPGNVGASWVWTALVLAVGTAVLIAAVWSTCWWLMARDSISALLRVRPARHTGARVSTPAGVLGALCLVGVVLTATKSLTGAAVQVAPLLLAGLVAIIVGILRSPVAARLVRRMLSRHRAPGALAVAQLGRRAGVVTAIATLIITSALLTLSVSVFARGADNRENRAAADVGAPALVQVTRGLATVHPRDLVAAIDSIDPNHREFTPAVQINAATDTSAAVLGVVPADMERIGLRAGLAQRVPWAALEKSGPASPPAALVATWTTDAHVGATVSAPTMADVDGPYRVVGTAPYIPGAGSRTIVVDLARMAKVGDRIDNVSFQVFSATQDPEQLQRLSAAVRRVGFVGTEVRTLSEARADYDATATAWAMNLSIVVSAIAVLAALVSVVLVAIASRVDRQRDLRALHTGGVSRTVLRRATVGEFTLLALLGSIIGSLTAPVAAWLIGSTMLWWSTPPDQPLTRTGFRWPAGVSAAVALVVLLLLVATALGTRIARSADRPMRGSTS